MLAILNPLSLTGLLVLKQDFVLWVPREEHKRKPRV